MISFSMIYILIHTKKRTSGCVFSAKYIQRRGENCSLWNQNMLSYAPTALPMDYVADVDEMGLTWNS